MRIQVPTNGQRIETLPDTVSVSVEECPRCGGSHDSVLFRRFFRPPASLGDTLYWTTCPGTDEPILGQMGHQPKKMNDTQQETPP